MASRNAEIRRHYHDAMAREQEVNQSWGRYLGFSAAAMLLPNVFAIPRLRRTPEWIRFIIAPGILLWCVVIQPLRTLVALVKHLGAVTSAATLTWSPTSVYLDSSNDRNLGFIPRDAENFPEAVVLLPFRRRRPNRIHGVAHIDLAQLSTVTTLLRAAWLSVSTAVAMPFGSARARGLFSYTAFPWFWTYLALMRSGVTRIWISNHYDRWTSLVASLPGAEVVIVQHGALAHTDDASGAKVYADLSAKIPNVRAVYVTTISAVEEFQRYIDGRDVRFTRFTPALESTPWRAVGGRVLKVLVLGHSTTGEVMDRAMTHLLQRHGASVDLAYRYHPTEARRVSAGLAKVWRLQPDGRVPMADVVLTYGSSVTDEIVASTGARVLTWNPNDADSVANALEQLRAMLPA
jgi:hypothetical protein